MGGVGAWRWGVGWLDRDVDEESIYLAENIKYLMLRGIWFLIWCPLVCRF